MLPTKDYIDNVDFKYNGHTAVEVAATFGYNDIVKILMPWMTETQEKKQNKIQAFIEETNSDKIKQNKIQAFIEKTHSDKIFARIHLSNHNWDINAAIQSFKTDAEENSKKIQNFIETTCTSDERIAKAYLSRHKWDINAALQSFFNNKSAIVSRNP